MSREIRVFNCLRDLRDPSRSAAGWRELLPRVGAGRGKLPMWCDLCSEDHGSDLILIREGDVFIPDRGDEVKVL